MNRPDLVLDPSTSYLAPEDPGEPGYGTKRLSVTDQEGDILSMLAIRKTVLEIGTGLGVSTRYLAIHARAVYTVDIDPWVQASIWPALVEENPNVIPLAALGELPPIDLAFIDGCHYAENVVADVARVRPYLKAHGKIVFHDANYLDLSGFGRVQVIHTTHGLGILEV
jgi:hypothetical protein